MRCFARSRSDFWRAFSSARAAAFSALACLAASAFSARASPSTPRPKNSPRRASVLLAAWLSASFFVRPVPRASPWLPANTCATNVRSCGGPWVSTSLYVGVMPSSCSFSCRALLGFSGSRAMSADMRGINVARTKPSAASMPPSKNNAATTASYTFSSAECSPRRPVPVSEEPNTMTSAKPSRSATSERLAPDTSATLMRVRPPSSRSWNRSNAMVATMAPRMLSPRNSRRS